MVLLRCPLKRRPPVVKATGQNEVKPGDKGVNAEPRSLSPRLSYTLASNPIWQSHNRITKAGPLANQSHASSHSYSPQSSSASAAGNTPARTSARLLKPADHSSRCEDTTPARNLVGCGANSRPSRAFLSPSGRIQRVTIVLKDGESPRPQPRRPSFTRFLRRFLVFLPSSTPTRFMFLHTINISAPCSTGFKTQSLQIYYLKYRQTLCTCSGEMTVFFLNTISLLLLPGQPSVEGISPETAGLILILISARLIFPLHRSVLTAVRKDNKLPKKKRKKFLRVAAVPRTNNGSSSSAEQLGR